MSTNDYSASQYLASAVFWIILIALYWAPTLVAVLRRYRSVGSVVVVNLFLAWTIIGWIVALAMAFSGTPQNNRDR